MMAAPPSNNRVGPPMGLMQQPPQSNGGSAPPSSNRGAGVTFFSTASGVPVPSSTAGAPPPSQYPVNQGPTNQPQLYGSQGGPPAPLVSPSIPTYQTAPGVQPPQQNFGIPPGPGSYTDPTSPYMAAPGVPQSQFSQPGMSGYPGPPGMPGQPGISGPTGMHGPPGMHGQPAPAIDSANSLPTLAEIDTSIKCNPAFLRSTVGKLVNAQSAANSSRLPLGIILKPMAGDVGVDNDQIDVVDFGATGIVRCRRCRTYINPYVTWMENGRRWKCNLCGMQNDCPQTYFSHLDSNGHRRDKDQRPELSKCSVEFVAPGEYMVRPPQPPVYFFVIDVSSVSASTGMLQSCITSIKAALDELPGGTRTQIGFVTFDSAIHFYNLKSTLSSPQMHVISDVTDIILPLPEDLLVNLSESRKVVESLLDSLPNMFKNNSSVNSCTGPALNAAKQVIQHIGGKLLLFQSTLPSIGEGSLKNRDNPRILGTDKEHTLLNPEDPWYKKTADDLSRVQVAVDTFLFSPQYTDLATISVLSKCTGGSCHYYPGFYGPRDGVKFERELHHCLTRATAFEAVVRVRATRGLNISQYYGNFSYRNADQNNQLLALPNCTSDTTIGLDIQYAEPVLGAQALAVQAALLYTSSEGERRIRVHTMLLPVCNSVSEMVDTVDINCTMCMLSKQAIDISQKVGLDQARSKVHDTALHIIRAAKGFNNPSGHHAYGSIYGAPQASPEAVIPLSLTLLPLYAMSLQKSLVLRGGCDIRIDERAFYQLLVLNMDIEESKAFIYSRMLSIADMPDDAGLPCDSAEEHEVAGPLRIKLPYLKSLSDRDLASNGIFLLENGYEMLMWIGRAVNPSIIDTLFGMSSLEGVDTNQLNILAENSDFSSRVMSIVVALRQARSRYMHLKFIKEGDGYSEAYLARFLVEDKANFPGGSLTYDEYHALISRG